jgi:uncharacterized protein (UPF0332 family)
MSPEAVDYLSTAEAMLERAERNFAAEIYEDAARNAYLAALNAARAVVFDKTTMAPKTHSGTRAKFHDLVREGMAFEHNLVKFLSDGFETKQGVDYGPEVVHVSRDRAEDHLRRATAFIAAAKKVCA